MPHAVITNHETTILARLLASEQNALPADLARYILKCGFDRHDRERMHDLAVRNQEGALTDDERSELMAYARSGTILSILKSRARRVLKINPKKRNTA